MAKQWNTQHNFIGKRVQLHPATDAWMQGDRYGEIVAIREDFTDPSTPKINSAKVLMDKSQRVLTLHADNVNLLS
tara:strand:- start:215 stop:439 length:225 start_codon:yes stop_codon:yes gene_type:complete